MKKPTQFSELIGPAAKVGRVLEEVIPKLQSGDDDEAKFLIYGPPGVGKSSLARVFSYRLAEPISVTEISGLHVNVELVRRWAASSGTLFGDWVVRWIDELDRVPRDAQDALLHYLDNLPPKTAFIGTSNMDIDGLQERFQTRLRTWLVTNPSTEEIMELLQGQGIDHATAGQIAVGSGGNVRAALLDARNFLDAQLLAA